jgi:hypothetical protein
MEFNDYYINQLKKLKNLDQVTIKLTDYDGNSTNYLTLNVESVEALYKLINELKDAKKL